MIKFQEDITVYVSQGPFVSNVTHPFIRGRSYLRHKVYVSPLFLDDREPSIGSLETHDSIFSTSN